MGKPKQCASGLRAERKQAQLQVEKLDQAISVIESKRFGNIRESKPTNPSHIGSFTAGNGVPSSTAHPPRSID